MFFNKIKTAYKASTYLDKIIYSQLYFEDLESIEVVLRQDPQLPVAYACERSDDKYSYKYEQHYENNMYKWTGKSESYNTLCHG